MSSVSAELTGLFCLSEVNCRVFDILRLTRECVLCYRRPTNGRFIPGCGPILLESLSRACFVESLA